MRPLAAIAGAALLLAGCGEKEEPSTATPPAEPKWQRTPGGLGEIPVADFNAYAERTDARWERSPLLVAAEFARVDQSQARTTKAVSRLPPEGGDTARVAVTFDGVLDDSIRSTRLLLDLARRADGTWRLTRAHREQRCHRGRGQADFEPEPCT